MANRGQLLFFILCGAINTPCYFGAPLEAEINSTSAPESVLRPLSDDEVSKMIAKRRLDQESRSSEWQQNALGKWTWVGKHTTKAATTISLPVNVTEVVVNHNATVVPQLSHEISINDKKDVKVTLESVASTTTPVATSVTGSTIAAVASSTLIASTTPSTIAIVSTTQASTSTTKKELETSSSTLTSAVIPQLTINNSTPGKELVKLVLQPVATEATTIASTMQKEFLSTLPAAVVPQLIAKNTTDGKVELKLVLEPAAVNVTEAMSTSTAASAVSVSSTTEDMKNIVQNALNPSLGNLAAAVLHPQNLIQSETQNMTKAQHDAYMQGQAKQMQNILNLMRIPGRQNQQLARHPIAEQNHFVPNALNTISISERVFANNETQLENVTNSEGSGGNDTQKTLYDPLSGLDTSQLKVGEQLVVSSVNAKTNTVVLSLHSDNATSDAVTTTAVSAAPVDQQNVVKQPEVKPESHLLLPLLQLVKPAASQVEHYAQHEMPWSLAPNQLTPSKYFGPKSEPKGEAHENWSAAASQMNKPKNQGPVPEPAKRSKQEEGGARGAQKANEEKHWSGPATELAASQYFGPRPAGTDGLGKSHAHAHATAAPGYSATVIGYDKVPYLWDSIMQGVMGMFGTANSFIAPVVQSDTAAGILSSIPTLDLSSFQNAKEAGQNAPHVNTRSKGKRN